MDVHERQSSAPAERWRAFQFSTLVLCALGILGNASSLIVLMRHLKDIAGSRLLLALAVADLGVVTSVASRILAYATYGNNELTQVIDWWFIYSYYCSIYFTVLLSFDRYVHTAKSMLLLRIDYHRLLKRTILAVLCVMVFTTLPHLLGNFVRYHHGSHTARADFCPSVEFCNSTFIPHGPKLKFCDRGRNETSLSPAEKKVYKQLANELCEQERNDTVEWWQCHIPPVSVAASKSKFPISALFQFDYYLSAVHAPVVTICSVGASAMKYDPEFVKAVYLGIDLPLRYVIPCCALAFVNIALVVAVRRAQQRHSDITQTAKKSLVSLPALRSALGIVFVFLACHTGGAGLFVINVFCAFANPNKGFLSTTVNVFVEDSIATRGLEMKYSAMLLAVVNSSINVALYCLFLPAFRKCWASLFLCQLRRCTGSKSRETIPDIIPLEEMELPKTIDVSVGVGLKY